MATQNQKWIRFHKIAPDIGALTLARIEKRNAFHDAMIEEFVEEMDRLSENPPRVLMVTGEGDQSFSAGYDLACVDPGQSMDDPLPDERFERTVLALSAFPSPVIALVNGSAYGGGLDLALACDFRFAAERPEISFAMPPCRLGLVYSSAGVRRFVEKLGSQTTRRLFLTGEAIGGAEALRLGMVDFLVPQEELMDRALEFAGKILKCSGLALAGTRRTIQSVEQGIERQDEPAKTLAQMRIDAFQSKHLRDFVAAFQQRIGGNGIRED